MFLILLKHFSIQKYCSVNTQEKIHHNVYAGHYDQCGTIKKNKLSCPSKKESIEFWGEVEFNIYMKHSLIGSKLGRAMSKEVGTKLGLRRRCRVLFPWKLPSEVLCLDILYFEILHLGWKSRLLLWVKVTLGFRPSRQE